MLAVFLHNSSKIGGNQININIFSWYYWFDITGSFLSPYDIQIIHYPLSVARF